MITPDTTSVFTLRPSRIETAGIGCFTEGDIAEGEYLTRTPEKLRRLCRAAIAAAHLKYCMYQGEDAYLAPQDFTTMSMFWYINHSVDPNIALQGNRLVTARDIEQDEELTLYYADLLTHPSNSLWVRPEHIRD